MLLVFYWGKKCVTECIWKQTNVQKSRSIIFSSETMFKGFLKSLNQDNHWLNRQNRESSSEIGTRGKEDINGLMVGPHQQKTQVCCVIVTSVTVQRKLAHVAQCQDWFSSVYSKAKQWRGGSISSSKNFCGVGWLQTLHFLPVVIKLFCRQTDALKKRN